MQLFLYDNYYYFFCPRAVVSPSLPYTQRDLSRACRAEGDALTFQGEDPLSQRVHDVFERRLVRHVEEVLLVWVAGDELDLLQEGLRVDPAAVVVTQNLQREPEGASSGEGQIKIQDSGASEGAGLTAMAYMVMLSRSLSATACGSCRLSCDSPSVITIITF